MKSTQLYDFTLAAGGSQVILADANFYKILTATGDLKITRDGGSTVRPMRAGRGEREVEFKALIVTDISGAPNSGTIVVGDSNFIDDTIVLSSAINVRPEVQSGFFSDASALVANTPITVFTPAANVNGAILLNANISWADGGALGHYEVFISKASAPANTQDGSILLSASTRVYTATTAGWEILQKEQFIAAGQGLYFMDEVALGVGINSRRSCRYKLL